MCITLYEMWMKDIILKDAEERELNFETMKSYQLKKIKETIDKAKNSRFYGETLKDIETKNIKDFNDFEKVPFTTSKDIINNPQSFICVPLGQISRIVTLKTSGTMGSPKRIFFTEKDLETTAEFFRYGMLNLVTPGQRVLILMPGNSYGSIGQLLKKGLNEAGCEGIIYGPVYDSLDALEIIKTKQIDCIVGIPAQVFSLAKFKDIDERYKKIKLKSILLSADYVPRSLCRIVGEAFKCPVFTHYGMTEMGYGGGVECSALNGYHMRDTDLYTEIVNPATCEKVEDGNYGEVVFTTLTREGMPLIRYRTGDIARFLPNECLCSNVFKRMDYIQGRLSERVMLKDGNFLTIGMLDEVMLKIDNLLDYRVTIKDSEEITIHIEIKPVTPDISFDFNEMREFILEDKLIASLIEKNNIFLEITYCIEDIEVSNGMMKRRLQFKRG